MSGTGRCRVQTARQELTRFSDTCEIWLASCIAENRGARAGGGARHAGAVDMEASMSA